MVFIGEAPWKDEDDLGSPFVGRAGHKMDEIIQEAFSYFDPPPTYALTNLIGCKPLANDDGTPGKPDVDEIEACSPRLREFVEIADPKLIVCVGRLADTYTTSYYRHSTKFHKSIPRASIVHPSWILRLQTARQGSETRRAVITLRDAVGRWIVGGGGGLVSNSVDCPDDIPF